MPMDNGAIIDTLKIEVVGDSSKGVRSLESVVSALEEIETLSKDVNRPMNRVTKAIDKLAASVDNISSSKLNKLTSLAQALRYMSSVGKISITAKTADVVRSLGEAVSSLQDVDMKKLNDMADGLIKLKSVGNLSSVTRTLGKVKDMPAPQEVSTTDGSADGGGEEVTGEKLSLMERAATRLGYKLDELKMKQSKLFAGFSNFMRLVKKRIMYRMLNALISKVVEAFSTGIKNVYQYSKAINGDFAKAMDTIATASLYLKNSIGASVTTLIQNLAPALDKIVDKVVDFLNIANQVIARLSGERTWIKAIKYPQEYADALGDASKKAKELKKSLLGIDELNQLQDNSNRGSGSNSDAEDYMYMFETMPLNYKYVDGIVDKLKGVWKYVKLIFGTIVGVKVVRGVATLMANVGTITTTVSTFFGKMPAFVKTLTGAAGLAGGIMLCHDAGKDFAEYLVSGNGLGGAFTKLVTGGVLAGAGGYLVGGPVGALIGALIALASQLDGVRAAQSEMRLEMMRADYYNNAGVEIERVEEALKNYFNSLDFDKQIEWIKKVEDMEKQFKNAADAYDDFWSSISKKTTFETSDLDSLADAFNALADAAKELSKAKIESIMSNIKSGIELNITPQLTEKLGELNEKLIQAQGLINNKIAGLSKEYQDILNAISANGGVASKEQMQALSKLRSDMTKFSLTKDSSTEKWNLQLDEALKRGINAGANKDQVIANINSLIGNRDSYLDALTSKHADDRTVLAQLINLDKTEFGGALGFSDKDLTLLDESFNKQRDEIYKQYNRVLDSLINTYSQNTVMGSGARYEKDHGNSFLNWAAGIGTAIVDWFDPGYEANTNLAREQEEILKLLKSLKIQGYASGGFPDVGELFLARENGAELVGSIGGKTAVMNNEQIVDSVSIGVAEANEEQNALLREQNNILRELLRKPTGGGADADDFIYSLNMKNRRDGKTVVPLGV